MSEFPSYRKLPALSPPSFRSCYHLSTARLGLTVRTVDPWPWPVHNWPAHARLLLSASAYTDLERTRAIDCRTNAYRGMLCLFYIIGKKNIWKDKNRSYVYFKQEEFFLWRTRDSKSSVFDWSRLFSSVTWWSRESQLDDCLVHADHIMNSRQMFFISLEA